ncbi:presequence protease, mitochondrial isoform X2 [Hemiscyllium ocellatum]|uniref:presequence protease, mitochondrial isoform X2 n=1 Tax=Hemiscyllium ocellatum TaxID=170820 RepID=UPI002966779B|nr:presequence protease, mitochondrial isoform X2 [Hemiscyllium ocellatum]
MAAVLRRAAGMRPLLSVRSGRSMSCCSWRWRSSSAQERARQYTVGKKIHGFTVNQVTPVPDLFLTAVKLNHDNTGAQHLHVARDDPNNLFSVQFRTTPLNSTGVPHILEHVVLCGSEKYQCRDPFFKMLTRSLATFMNAFTANDYTMYPFSTQNSKDFQNLLSVYLDAVFFPCLRELDFWQEGWRLEHEIPDDPGSPLIFKGVVFNEMKGVFANNENLYAQHLQNKLLPEHTYSVVSGGDPLHIPKLTWEELKNFHATHYHPSNARFFTYGDLPLEQHLQQIQDEALCKFSKIEPGTSVPKQSRWSEPRECHVNCGPDSMAPDPAKQTIYSVSFLLGDITDSFEAFTLNLLSSLLVSGPNSPFYKALIDAHIGTDFAPVVGYDGSTREACFTIGLQGIAEQDIKVVKEIIAKVIDEVIENGFEQERIEALLHKIEIQLKHQTTNFGLALASYIAANWNHDGDPVEMLQISENMARFKQSLEDNPHFLQDKVKHYFKENAHQLSLSMSPDESYLKNQAQLEKEKLQEKVNSLSMEEKKEIYKKGLELIAAQSRPQDASSLPALKVSDIQQTFSLTPVEMTYIDEVPVQYCSQPTNGVVYFKAFTNLNTLPEDLKPYVPLFCNVITRMGCGNLDYRKQDQQIELKTGGMFASPKILQDNDNLDMYEQGVLFTSHCLERNLPDMMHLWTDIFNNPHFDDEEHLRVLVMMAAQELSNGIPESGHLYAAVRAGKTLTAAGRLQEMFNGISQVQHMKRIAEKPELLTVLRKLPRIKMHLLSNENMRCAVNATSQAIPEVSTEVEKFIRNIPGFGKKKKDKKLIRTNITEKPLNPEDAGSEVSGGSQATKKIVFSSFKACQMKTHFQLPFPVNYVSECVRTVPYLNPDFPSLLVLARLLTSKFLHREIREKGGAYGGGAMLSHNGLFTFYSYRDPNSIDTMSVFQKSIDWAKAGKFTQEDIDEAKLSVFSTVDAPVAPSNRGLDRFLLGISDEMKQKHREQLFAVDHDSLVGAANKYLTTGHSTWGAAILGPENESIARDPTWVQR